MVLTLEAPLTSIGVILTLCTHRASRQSKKRPESSEGLGTILRDEPKNLVRFRCALLTKRKAREFHMSWAFFDFNEIHRPVFNDIHRPNPGPQEIMQIGGVRCAISQIWPKFREMLGENPADIHL